MLRWPYGPLDAGFGLAHKNSSYREKYYNLAIECYDKMIEANPQNIESYKEKIEFLNQLAEAAENSYNEEKYYNLAIECYDKAIELKPSSELYENKAKILDSLSRYSEAKECRRKATDLGELGL